MMSLLSSVPPSKPADPACSVLFDIHKNQNQMMRAQIPVAIFPFWRSPFFILKAGASEPYKSWTASSDYHMASLTDSSCVTSFATFSRISIPSRTTWRSCFSPTPKKIRFLRDLILYFISSLGFFS